jgi:predicted metalloprotease with PDZ domain
MPATAQPYAGEDPREWLDDIRTHYVVDASRSAAQLITLTLTLEGLDQDFVELNMPAWRPGRYEIIDPAGTIRTLSAVGPDGQQVPNAKINKATWRFETEGMDRLEVSYTIYANSLANRTRHADSTHAFLSPSTVFLYAPDRRDEPVRVDFEIPGGWRVSTGLDAHPDHADGRVFVARDFDTLVDSPFEVGEQDVIEFEVRGVPHEIVIWGQHEADPDKLAADFAKIVEHQAQIFEGDGPLPYGFYVFQIHCGPGMRGGTEHINSTIMGADPQIFFDDRRYENFLGLVSHEMFHTWNVKRLRPAGLTPYDYQQENYTDLLWVAEGTTSYYDDLTLARVGLISIDTYLDKLKSSIGAVHARPGLMMQTLAESSFDAWIKFNKATPDSPNATVSFYNQGALASLLVDLWIREQTSDQNSLDTVMRDLYQRHPLESGGFTTEDLAAAIDRAAGTEAGEARALLTSLAETTGDLPLTEPLARIGLELSPRPDTKGSDLGLTLSARDGFALVTGVREGGPSFDADIIVDDMILAVNGQRASTDDLSRLLDRTEVGTTLALTTMRRGRLLEVEVTTAAKPLTAWNLRRVKEPTDEQKASFEAWLHQSWPD